MRNAQMETISTIGITRQLTLRSSVSRPGELVSGYRLGSLLAANERGSLRVSRVDDTHYFGRTQKQLSMGRQLRSGQTPG